MPRSINHAKRNEPNLQAAQGQTTSHATATASRNGEPRDDHGKPEWRATRRPRQAGMASHVTAPASRNGEPRASHHATIAACRNGALRDGHDEPERQKREAPATGRFDNIDRLFHKLCATSRRATMARRNEGRNPPATAPAPVTRLHRLQRYVQRYRIRLYANIDAIRATARTVRSHTGNRRPHRQSKTTPAIECHAGKSKRTKTLIYRPAPSGRR